MKKIILFVVLLFGVVLSMQAQQKNYLGEVNFGIGYGPFADRWLGLSISTVHGARIGDHFSVGGGVGLEFLAGVDPDNCTLEESEFVCCHHSESKLLVPLYLNLKGYLDTSKPTTGYLTLDIGVVPHLDSDKMQASFYLCPAVGIKARRFKADIGYKLIEEHGAIQLRLGLFLGGGKYNNKYNKKTKS